MTFVTCEVRLLYEYLVQVCHQYESVCGLSLVCIRGVRFITGYEYMVRFVTHMNKWGEVCHLYEYLVLGSRRKYKMKFHDNSMIDC